MEPTKWDHYNKNRYVDAVKMTRFALTQLGSSKDIYTAIGQPLVSRTDTALSGHVLSSYKKEHPNWTDEHEAGDIIRYGVRDTHALLFPYLSKKTSRESALQFLHHERTMGHLAVAALRTEEAFNNLVKEIEYDGHIPSTIPYIELPSHVIPQQSGCPAAAVGKDRKPTQEFVDLSILSGEVLIEALAHHGRLSDRS